MEQPKRLSLSAYAAFVRALSRLRDAKEAALISQERSGDLDPLTDAAPERRARRDLIDGVLEALGWDIAPFSRTIVEEARLRREDRTRYADYLGFTFPAARPVLLVEAKEIDAAAPSPQKEWLAKNDDWANTVPKLIQSALAYNVCPEGPAPLSKVWLDWLSDLRDYATRCVHQHGHAPRVALITSGNWWLLITDTASLISGTPIPSDALRYFPSLETIACTDFFESAARRELAKAPDVTIEPGELLHYCAVNEIVWIGNALWTSQSNDGLPRYAMPRLKAGAAMTVVLADSTVLRVASPEGSVVQTDPELLAQHFDEIRAIRGRLVQSLKEVASTLPAQKTLEELDTQFRTDRKFITWQWPTRANVWVSTLGEAEHFLAPNEEFLTCPHHDYAVARDDGHGLREPRLNPSVEPPVHFPSGHPMHCASQLVHDARESKCRIVPVDEALCCRACRYCAECWTEVELNALPCNALRKLT